MSRFDIIDEKGLCVVSSMVDKTLFQPKGESKNMDAERVADAKEICGRCLARAACRDLAIVYITNGTPILGVWGGGTVKEIKDDLAREQRIATRYDKAW